MNIYVDSKLPDDGRRAELYRGAIFVESPSASALKLCKLAQEMIEEAFHPVDPMKVHEQIPAEKCAEILAVLKPKFIHHPLSKQCIREMMLEAGCDLSQTYFDVPRLRTAFPGDYLKSGIAYAFHPHRDTWYSAPFCQINWWMPVYELNSENCMALHPHYFDRAIKNGSRDYNYHKWNLESRQNAAKHIKTDTRVQPRPEEPIELDPQIRLVCEVGGAYHFLRRKSPLDGAEHFQSAALQHRFPHRAPGRRVSVEVGASNVDSECTGTTMGDYLRGTDLTHLPESAIATYQDGTELVYARA